MTHPAIEVHRVYDDPKGAKAEYRVLVDRLWPRGVSKSSVRLDSWPKDLAPSTELRRWYGHAPERFPEFSRRYLAELRQPPAVEEVRATLSASARHSKLVLVTATKDVEHSGAVVLARHLGRVSRARGHATR